MSVKRLLSTLTLVAIAGLASAADDPAIQGELRTEIQQAMRKHIADNTVDGFYRHFDPVDGQLLRLRLQELHTGIVGKAEFYVSCADFVNPEGKIVDLDFLVIETVEGLRVTQAIVHKANGVKRPYHLESD